MLILMSFKQSGQSLWDLKKSLRGKSGHPWAKSQEAGCREIRPGICRFEKFT